MESTMNFDFERNLYIVISHKDTESRKASRSFEITRQPYHKQLSFQLSGDDHFDLCCFTDRHMGFNVDAHINNDGLFWTYNITLGSGDDGKTISLKNDAALPSNGFAKTRREAVEKAVLALNAQGADVETLPKHEMNLLYKIEFYCDEDEDNRYFLRHDYDFMLQSAQLWVDIQTTFKQCLKVTLEQKNLADMINDVSYTETTLIL